MKQITIEKCEDDAEAPKASSKEDESQINIASPINFEKCETPSGIDHAAESPKTQQPVLSLKNVKKESSEKPGTEGEKSRPKKPRSI